MSHRFIRVTIKNEKLKDFNAELINYIKRLEEDDPGMVYYNVQEDTVLFDMVVKFFIINSDKLCS
jgi:hypothetical protein